METDVGVERDADDLDVVQHIPALRGYAWSVTRQRSKVDDLVQETLVKAIASEHQYRRGANLRPSHAGRLPCNGGQRIKVIQHCALFGITDPGRGRAVGVRPRKSAGPTVQNDFDWRLLRPASQQALQLLRQAQQPLGSLFLLDRGKLPLQGDLQRLRFLARVPAGVGGHISLPKSGGPG